MNLFLKSKRIDLFEFEDHDHNLIKELDGDPEVMKYITNGNISNDAEVNRAIGIFTSWTKKYNARYGYWKAIERDSGEFIGWFHLRPLKDDINNLDNLEIGYRLLKKYWGKGYATEVSRKLIQYAVNKLDVKEIWALAMKENHASQAVMKKCLLEFERDDRYEDFPGDDKSSVWYRLKIPSIRKGKMDDIESVMNVHRRSIREICSKDYNEEQIAKWSDVNYSMEIWTKTINDDCYYVYERDSQIVGFCHALLRENNIGEIVGMYFAPEIKGLGLGAKIFSLCMDYLDNQKVDKVIIHGTKTAKPFYESMGFKTVEKKESNIRGAIIESYLLEKKIIN